VIALGLLAISYFAFREFRFLFPVLGFRLEPSEGCLPYIVHGFRVTQD
jgi:hypothetical protein